MTKYLIITPIILGFYMLGFYRQILTLVVTLCILLLSPLSSPLLAAEEQHAKPKVVTTTNIVYDLVKQIGGEHLELHALMGAGIDPHYYRATFGDLRRLSRADAVFYNGFALEGRMESALQNLKASRPVIALADAIEHPIYEGTTVDPHIWLDVGLWRQAAQLVYRSLAELFPQYQAEFKANHLRYDEELAQLDLWIEQQIASIPRPQRLLITAHDAFGYYSLAYDIEVMALQGINTTAEYGLRDLNRLKEVIKERRVKAVFVESTLPKRAMRALIEGVNAEGGQISLGGELYTDALGARDTPQGNYIGMMRHNTQTLVEALR